MDQNHQDGQVHEEKVVHHSSKNKLKSLRDKLPKDKNRLILLGLITLAIPLTVGLTLVQQEIRSRASGADIASVAINPGSINSSVNGQAQEMSALAYDSSGNPIFSDVHYQWSMSSTNSVGTLSKTEGEISQFTPLNSGCGALTVTAISGGQIVSKSTIVSVSDGSSTPDCGQVAASKPSRVFATSTAYDGNLGGISGADAKCQTSANNANLGGTWKAWISDDNISASSRLIHSEDQYKLLDGKVLANNWGDLTDGEINYPIDLTEIGTKVVKPYAQAWTNTNNDGSIKKVQDPNFNYSCENWTNNSFASKYAWVGVTDSTRSWSDIHMSQLCGSKLRLYCFEQIEDPTPTPNPTAGPTPIPTEAPFRIIGKHVDVNGDPISIAGQSVTIANISANTSQTTNSTPNWSFDDLARTDYRITASQIPGYRIEHMVCYECIDQDRFFNSNSFVLNSTNTEYVGITFKYIPVPTPTDEPTPTPTPISITVTPSVRTMILNPSADAFVRSTAPNQNFGTNANLRNDSNPNEVSFLKFNLTKLAGKTIKSAKLRIKASDATTKTLTLRRVSTANWSEGGIKFNNRPSFEGVITTFTATSQNQVKELNVIGFVNTRKGGNMTLGITSGGDETGAFYSRESAAANRPQLIVEYQ